MALLNRSLYVFDTDLGIQIDPAEITMEQGVVRTVVDTAGELHEGTNIVLRTPRDFVHIEDLQLALTVGDEIYLDNQSLDRWTVRQGWYSVDGNSPIYGWYLESIPVGRIRSLYLKDLDSITLATPGTSLTLPQVGD